MENGKPKVVLFDIESLFCHDPVKFCRDFSREVIRDYRFGNELYRTLFSSGLSSCCNRGELPFEGLFEGFFGDYIWRIVQRERKNSIDRQMAYTEFERLWNASLMYFKPIADEVLGRINVPIVLVGATNPLHCAKIKASEVTRLCKACLVYTPERHAPAAYIERMCNDLRKIGFEPATTLHVSNGTNHSLMTTLLGKGARVTIHQGPPSHLYNQLTQYEVVT